MFKQIVPRLIKQEQIVPRLIKQDVHYVLWPSSVSNIRMFTIR